MAERVSQTMDLAGNIAGPVTGIGGKGWPDNGILWVIWTVNCVFIATVALKIAGEGVPSALRSALAAYGLAAVCVCLFAVNRSRWQRRKDAQLPTTRRQALRWTRSALENLADQPLNPQYLQEARLTLQKTGEP